jgi:hypothetical protein
MGWVLSSKGILRVDLGGVRQVSTSDDARRRLDETMEQLARDTGGTLHIYPRPGEAQRRIVLRDVRTGTDSSYEDAVVESDGTVRVTGVDRGAKVSSFFGEDIVSYDWVYVVSSERVADLVAALGGGDGDDVLALLAAYYERENGRLYPLLTSAAVGAAFSNWHSAR